ncbi:hypothetical protein D3C77_378730 [compost metagenome]
MKSTRIGSSTAARPLRSSRAEGSIIFRSRSRFSPTMTSSAPPWGTARQAGEPNRRKPVYWRRGIHLFLLANFCGPDLTISGSRRHIIRKIPISDRSIRLISRRIPSTFTKRPGPIIERNRWCMFSLTGISMMGKSSMFAYAPTPPKSSCSSTELRLEPMKSITSMERSL